MNTLKRIMLICVFVLLAVPTIALASSSDITVESLTNQRALVNWGKLVPVDKNNYDVKITTNYGSEVLYQEITSEIDKYFSNLKPYTTYTVEVKHRDGIEKMSFKTKAITPDRPEVKFSSLSANTALIGWKSNNMGYAANTNYSVKIRNLTTNEVIYNETSTEMDKYFNTLTPATTYEVIVSCERNGSKSMDEYRYFTTKYPKPKNFTIRMYSEDKKTFKVTWDFDFDVFYYEVLVNGQVVDIIFDSQYILEAGEGSTSICVRGVNESGSGYSNTMVINK